MEAALRGMTQAVARFPGVQMGISAAERSGVLCSSLHTAQMHACCHSLSLKSMGRMHKRHTMQLHLTLDPADHTAGQSQSGPNARPFPSILTSSPQASIRWAEVDVVDYRYRCKLAVVGSKLGIWLLEHVDAITYV